MKNFYLPKTRAVACFICLLFLLNIKGIAQTPAYSKTGGTSNSTFAWGGGTSSKKVQLLYLPGDMAPAVTVGTITNLYFMYGSTGNVANTDYVNLEIKIGQTTNTGFNPATSFYTGLTTVFSAAAYSVPAGTSGNWFQVVLQNPYSYDNTKTLIVEIAFDSYTNTNNTTGLGTYTTASTGKKLNAATRTATTGSTNTTVQNIGFDLSLAPCTEPPTAGTASATAQVCPGTAVSLGLSGNSSGTGQTYKWQSSSTLAGTYTDVSSPATSPSLTVNPTVNTFYRCAVTCGASTVNSTPVEVKVKPSLSGAYDINSANPNNILTGGRNFQTFAEVVSYLNCGIAGPVVFNVASGGTYTEQVVLNAIPGASTTNTITFNGNGSTLTFPATLTGERATLKLDGADHVRFNDFIITATGTTYGYGIHILNNADSNVVSNCTINIPTNSSSANYSGIVVNSSSGVALTLGDANCDSLSIINNTINGGAYGIIVVADGPTNYNYNTNIYGNTIREFANYGVYINGGYNTLVEKNDISRPTRSANLAVFYGIYFNNTSLNCRVSKNKVHSTFDASPTSTLSNIGIQFNNCDATLGNENIISNNTIYHFTGASIHYGLYNSSSDYVKYYHNSVFFGNETPSGTTAPTRAFYQTGAAIGIEFKNNILKVTREGTSEKWGLYFGTSGADIVSNNNDVYVSASSGASFGYYNSANQAAITNWRTASGQDANSKSLDPLFVDGTNGDLKPTENSLNDIGTPVGIATDIVGITRNAIPDAGAYEFDAGPCTTPPIPGNAIFFGGTPVCEASSVSLDLENNSVGLGQTYKWQSSTTAVGTYSDISTASASTSFTINPTANLYYRAAVTCGASTAFSAPIQVNIKTAFAGGTYTINSGAATGGTNFQNFGDAVLAISCGITSSTIFNVVSGSGPYNEQVILPAIPGLSASKTITFNGNGATISYTSSNTAERATVKLNGTDYVTLDSLVINATGISTTEYGFGIQLINGADNNTIKRCTVSATATPATAASSSFAGIVISGSPTSATGVASDCDSNIIIRNTITGGYYGVTLVGNGTAFVHNNKITQNTITDFYSYGIYVSATNNTLIEKNNISRPLRTSVTAFYGVYFTTSSTNARVSKNKIHNSYDGSLTATSATNGIYFTSCDATLGNENIVSNNLIYNCKSDGPISAIYHSSSDYVKYYHNTISLDDQSSAAAAGTSTTGILLFNDDPGVEFKNNIVTITRSGPSLKRAINVAISTATNFQSDYNILYVNAAAGNNDIGLFGTPEFATLTDWKTANSGAYDQHSKSINPLFVDAANGDYTPAEQTINGIGLNLGFTTDINDSTRVIVAPDPGAVEFGNNACTAPPTAGTSIIDAVAAVCPGTPILLNVTGNSTGVSQTYQWQISSAIAGTYTNVSGLLYTADFSTASPTATSYYRCAITCGASTVYSTPVQVLVPLLFSGTYTIDSNLPTGASNFQTFADAYNAIKCGIGGNVVFNVNAASGPYNEQVVLPFITGMLSHTITYNGNGTNITFLSTNTNERAVIKLDSAKNVTFNNFVITPQGTTTGQYGYGVQLLRDADNNTISNCIININTSSTSTNYSGIVINSSAAGTYSTAGDSKCDNNTFVGNTITGGYTGIALTANTGTNIINGNKVIGNTVTDFYSYGIHINGNNNVLIEGNEISRPTRSTVTTFYGINFDNTSTNSIVSKNKIHDPFGGVTTSTAAGYGIRLANCDAALATANTISNNIIYNFIGGGTGTNTYNGILVNSSDYLRIYHNSISIDDASSSCNCPARGVYAQPAALIGLDIRNNVISVTRGGTGEKQAVYFEQTSATAFTVNGNNYFVGGSGGTQEIAHMGASGYTTLAAWQTASAQEAKSKTEDPLFTNAPAGDLKPLALTIDNIGVPVGIPTDITGVPRGNVSPDAGAYEFGTVVPISLLSFTGERKGNFNLLQWTTANEINNAGFELQRSIDGASFSKLVFIASKAANGNSNLPINYRFDDIKPFLTNGYYRLKQVDKDGKSTYHRIILIKGINVTELTINSIYPNPTEKYLNILLSSPIANNIKVIISDAAGKILIQKQKSILVGDNNVQLDVQNLSKGAYVLKIECNSGCQGGRYKFIKQ